MKACKDAFVKLDKLSQEELVLAALNENPSAPDFGFIESWNSNISFSHPPNGVSSTSSSYIKDAWIRIISINPSMENRKILYVPSKGEILSAYNYRVDVPSGNVNGDCFTDYRLVTNNVYLDIYSNKTLIGHGNSVNFDINSDSTFTAILRIDVTITENHHKEVRYCCSSNRRGCTRYCTECRYQNTDYLNDYVELKDTLNVSFYRSDFDYDFSWIGIDKAKIKTGNQTAIRLFIGNSSYDENPFAYKLVSKFQPYDVLSYKALNQAQVKSRNLRYSKENNSISLAANGDNCSLELRNYFSTLKPICPSRSNISKLEMSTDKLVYLDGEAISVYIDSDKPVLLAYGNKTFSGNGNFSLIAAYNENVISVNNGDSKQLSIVSVQNKDKLSFALLVTAFSALNYGAYIFLRRIWSF